MINDELNIARIACYNALADSDDEKRRYWGLRFIKAMRPVMTSKGKIRRKNYRRRTVVEVKPIDDILREINE